MSKKTFIIIAVLLGIMLAVLVGYYFNVKSTNPDGTSTGTSGFLGLFPFGGGGDNTEPATSTGNGGSEFPVTQPVQNFNQKLRQISMEPVAGAGTMEVKIDTSTKSTLTGTVVRYIEKATGHIYETDLFDAKSGRISNTTIPVVYDAIWGNTNKSLIARYLKNDDQTVDTYSLTLKNLSTTTENNVAGVAFPANISDVSVLGNSLFYLQQNSLGSVGFVSNFDGTSKKQVWNSEIKDLLAQYVNATTVALTTKPAQGLPGFLYFVNTTSGSVKKILGGGPGLSTLTNPDANKVLHLANSASANMYIYDTSTGANIQMTPTTFPEKCVWSKKDKTILYCAVPREGLDGSSLTAWYQGFVAFTDDVWRYDTKNNTATVVENLSDDAGASIDVIKPILSESEQYFVFMNKRDNTLWSLDLGK